MPPIQNRTFAREIEQRLKASAAYTDGIWKWHTQRWGDLDVLVIPRQVKKLGISIKRVVDSNTGIVTIAPKHAYLLGNVVVNDGARINCDIRALNHMVNGDASLQWDSPGLHAYAVPSDAGYPQGIEAARFNEVIAKLKESGLAQDQAFAQGAYMAGWGAFSIQCVGCRLVVPCGSVERVMSEAKRYDFKMTERCLENGVQKRAMCRRCAADPGNGPILPWPESL